MGSFDGSLGWLRVECPHEDRSLKTWRSLFGQLQNGQSRKVSRGQRVLLGPEDVARNAVVHRIVVEDGAEVVLDDKDITLNVREIRVLSGGAFRAGSESCRLYSKINIVFHGSRGDSTHTNDLGQQRTMKGLISQGNLQLHGKLYWPTWTRLARSARAGDSIIFVGDQVNWEVGQEIVVLTSDYFDCPAQFQHMCNTCSKWHIVDPKTHNCRPVPHQNEKRTIVATSMDCIGGERAIQLDRPLEYLHFASEYQTEVVLLSRRITLSGTDSKDDFGGHTAVVRSSNNVPAVGKFSGVRSDNMGQLNVLKRYPFHLHLLGEDGRNSFFQDCSVTNSHYRAFTIHGTNSSRISRNTAYNVKGFAYYLEDGVEEKNLFEYNMAAHVHPIFKAADGPAQGNSTRHVFVLVCFFVSFVFVLLLLKSLSRW